MRPLLILGWLSVLTAACPTTLPCSEEGCAPGQVCALIGQQEQCAPDCAPDGSCPSGYVCAHCLPPLDCPECAVCAESACVRPIR